MFPRLPSISGEKAVSAFKKAGWTVKSRRGSHVKLIDSAGQKTIIVPVHKGKSIDRGLLIALIKQAGLSVEKFIEFLK